MASFTTSDVSLNRCPLFAKRPWPLSWYVISVWRGQPMRIRFLVSTCLPWLAGRRRWTEVLSTAIRNGNVWMYWRLILNLTNTAKVLKSTNNYNGFFSFEFPFDLEMYQAQRNQQEHAKLHWGYNQTSFKIPLKQHNLYDKMPTIGHSTMEERYRLSNLDRHLIEGI